MDLRVWLGSLGLEEYTEILRLNSIDLDSVHTLQAQDLRDLGMVSVGHRRRFLDAAKALRHGPVAAKERSFLWQRRHMTILFLDLVDFTARSHQTDPELLQNSVSAFYDLADRQVGTFGGRVLKRLGDGLLVGFGWPVAHEDDALRACLCALAIRTALAEGGIWSIRVGGASGFVFVGGEPADAIGDVVNLASRLQEAADPGQILVAEATQTLARAGLVTELAGPLALKGLALPVTAFAVTAPSDLRQIETFDADTQLVGRSREFGWLKEHWAAARGGSGRVVLVEGQAGIGKTALSRHLARAARQDGGRVLWSLSYEWLSGSALEPVLSLATMLCGEQVITERLRQTTPSQGPKERRNAMFAALQTLLFDPDAAQPRLFILDDAQWADGSTIDFLRSALAAIHQAPCLIVLNVRRDDAAQHPDWWPDFDAALTLQPLQDAEADLLLDQLDCLPQTDRFARRDLIARCGGVPLFLRELGLYWSDHGLLADQKNTNPAGTGTTAREKSPDHQVTAMPTRLVDLMIARIDSLAPRQKDFALAASCIGQEFTLETLAVVANLPLPRITAVADAMIGARIFQRGQTGFRFDHPLLCDAAYGLVSLAERQQLHARILDASDPTTTRPELLARHALGAGRLEDAIRWSTEAGRQSLAAAALREAVMHYRRALSAIQALADPSPARRAEEASLYLKLAHALNGVYGSGAAETAEAFGRSTTLAKATEDANLFFPAAYGVSVTAFVRADISQGRAAADLMLERARTEADNNHRYMAQNIRATIEMFAGNFAAAEAIFADVAVLEPTVRPQDLIWSYGHDPRGVMRSHRAMALLGLGQPQTALAVWNDGLSIVTKGTHRQSIAQPLLFGSMLQIAQGQTSIARDLVDRALQLTEELALTMWEHVARCLDAYLMSQGGFSPANAALKQIRGARTALEDMGVVYVSPILLRLEASMAEASHERKAAVVLRTMAEALESRTGCRWVAGLLARLENG
jgi:class 3 adenylate cyclase